MQILSVNIGRVTPIQNAKKSGVTGIYKQPAAEPVAIHFLGISGDGICDTENHGGLDQAIYVYGAADYDWWSKELNLPPGAPLAPGTFGENLTISEMESAHYSIGDRFHIGPDLILEVTAPRIPCVTLAARMNDPQFVKRFRYAERPGLYCRVIHEGMVSAGDLVTVEPYRGETLSAMEMFREFYNPHPSADYLQRYLNTPTPIKGRDEVEAQLNQLKQP